MYTEEIKYLSYESLENTHENKIRNTYFENRNCLINLLDFLNQEVVILPSSYFSYAEGPGHILEDGYLDYDVEDESLFDVVIDKTCQIEGEDGYHISVLDDYITIIAQNKRCLFTNKDMEEGNIIGSVIWVKNFNELLKKFEKENLKRISKAIVHPHVIKTYEADQNVTEEGLIGDFFLSMEIYKPETVYKYAIDSHMENICIDVYNRLTEKRLNCLVDKHIQKYKRCNGYGTKGEEGYSTQLCKCGRLRALCYLNLQ
ncbi:hypothetical protein CONCODRAFT_15738 [Conidiobolus coronatus NRRL 28638]|uniref:Uncharacterized protein n=1 Tax=Conidiobolus coronatus (strain ATCC 28846 / CBS 209.66 / NRRL 28638) TaxID=796925 RepID=A0A137PDF6_CONC2|nr:hypothetical protein CONCODRAFT_15738 [Conidiobolus coronatus NRRL 28638]|eukprot:KXN73020.1 hypothetical protein CONCODRAFT_15738 [Conidiobolus coronatus NRRL 28638]